MSKPSSPLSGLARAVRTVGSAMMGVRGRKHHEEDSAALSPLILALVAVIFMVFFVGGLVALATVIAGA